MAIVSVFGGQASSAGAAGSRGPFHSKGGIKGMASAAQSALRSGSLAGAGRVSDAVVRCGPPVKLIKKNQYVVCDIESSKVGGATLILQADAKNGTLWQSDEIGSSPNHVSPKERTALAKFEAWVRRSSSNFTPGTTTTTLPPGLPPGSFATLSDGHGTTISVSVLGVEFPTTGLENKTAQACTQATYPVSPSAGQRFEAVELSVRALSGQWQIPTQWLNVFGAAPLPSDGAYNPQSLIEAVTDTTPSGLPDFFCNFYNQAESNVALLSSSGAVQGWVLFSLPSNQSIVKVTASAVASGLQDETNIATWSGFPT